MSEEKETIFLRVSPELKRAVKIAATSEHRKMANFVEAVLFANPKVKEALEQEGSKNSENNAKEEKESLKQEKGKESVQKTEKKKEEQEVNLERMKHSF